MREYKWTPSYMDCYCVGERVSKFFAFNTMDVIVERIDKYKDMNIMGLILYGVDKNYIIREKLTANEFMLRYKVDCI